MVTVEQNRCTHTQLDHDIHELTFMESSRTAVDDLVTHIKAIMEATPLHAPPGKYLIDCSRVDVPPLKYIAGKVKYLESLRPAERTPAKISILYEGFLGTAANTILSFAMKNRFRFFKPGERDAALAWLIQDE